MKPIISITCFKTASGREPFWDWYDSLDKSEQAIIQARLDRIEAGNLGVTGRITAAIKEI